MALAPGTRLGVYEVVAQIGVGGMGEVYRARDTRLDREIALKVLPDALLSHPDRVARFQREARTLASLNHPNIGGIHGLEERDGITALILELVEGPTLADRIALGRMPLEEALRVATQIAEALEAAHEQGITHRDLKPANIKVRPDGTVKVLDFGLAKAIEAGSAGSDVSLSPTIASPAMTATGMILGTAAYMSPEQARGLTVDRRTDIWAFGCVLYETIVGHALFDGTTASDIIAAILKHEPDWSTLPTETPAGIRRLLARCLDKDLKRRLQHIGEARIEIENVLSGDSSGLAASPVVNRSRRPVLLLAAAAMATIAALTAVMVWTSWRAPARQARTSARVSRTMIAASGAKSVSVAPRTVAITPDGTRIIYIGNNRTQIFVRPLNELEPTAIVTGTAPLGWPFVSPDGQWIGFVDGNVLKKVAITGGPALTLAAPVAGAAWAADNTIIVANGDRSTGLQRVSADGGQASQLTQPDANRGELAHISPEMLPGGRAVLFTITAMTGGPDAAQVAVLDLLTKQVTVVVRGGSHAHYVANGDNAAGHLVFTAAGTLRAIPFDVARLQTRGTAATVLTRLATTPLGTGSYDVSADGTLVYVAAADDTASARTLVWVDREGHEEPLMAPPRAYFQSRVSPDGARIAAAIEDEGNDIWVFDVARRTLSRRTFDPAVDFFPVWTPDGQKLVFASQREAGSALFWQPADGTGTAEPLGSSNGLPSAVTPDGTRVLFHTNFGNRELMTLALDTHRIQPLLQASSNERNAIVSRDGRWLAYESDRSTRFEIYIRPFPDLTAGEWQISTGGGLRPVWAPNGKELFYETPDGAIIAVPVDARGDAWRAGTPMKVVQGPYLSQSGGSRAYDVSADGRRFLMIKQPPNPDAPQIIVVQNWVEELNRLAP